MGTLYDAKLDLAKLIMRVKTGTVTSVTSAGQFYDIRRTEPNDYFYRIQSNGGTLFFPDRRATREITLYEKVGPEFQFTPADITPAVGEKYIASPVEWDFYELTQAINLALEDLGEESGVPQIDETTVLVADQHIYTLPGGVSNVKQVHIIYDEDAPEDWTERHMSWEPIGDQVIFDQGSAPVWGDYIKFVFCAPHAEVEIDFDTISPYINPMLLKWTAAVYALENVNKDARIVAKLNRAIKTSEAYKSRHPFEMQRDPHLNFEVDEGSYG